MSEKAIKTLNRLIQLDLSAIRTYEEAIEGAESLEIRSKLTEFMSDHQKHVVKLSDLVSAYGGKPAERRDFTGVLLEALTAILAMGDRTALLAMRVNAEISNQSYEAALSQKLPKDIQAVVEKNYKDEQEHLAWIKKALQKLD
jgi:uncharacterized protein (TIGR02284 family)